MLAVVAFPVLAEEDGRKIEALREQHDPNAARIAAHFTLVFPTGRVGEKSLLKRVEDAAGQTPPFDVALKRILVHQEGVESYLYLVPEAGYDALVAMHARLNDGGGGKFTPHVTIARLGDRKQARAVATGLATTHFSVNGRVETLSLVEVTDAGPVRAISTSPLRG
jgi:2'-5' RNA ligase